MNINNLPKNDLFLRACKRESIERTPIWLMRQAGRYMPEYRKLREIAGSFKSFYKNVELSVKASLLPHRILGVDAIIIFSDILTPLESIGLNFEFREGEGPVFLNPITRIEDIKRLKKFNREDVNFVGEIIKGVNKELGRELPVIGFCGAPFTLAVYTIEGKGSKDFKRAKKFMYDNPNEFKEYLNILSDMLIDYLNFQIESGVDAVQIFDTWAGILTPDDYREFSLPFIKKIIENLNRSYQPVIHFSKSGSIIENVIKSGADVYSIDWTVDLTLIKEKSNGKFAVQGNLDPTVLYARKDVIKERALKILQNWGNDTGHIFNLGHGLMPDMEQDKVKYLVEVVKKFSERH